MSDQGRYQTHTHSYLALRKAVGWIGVTLPFVMMLGVSVIFDKDVLQESISHYYYTGMGDVFVGALCAVALFMFFYRGYDAVDDWLGNAAGLFALGVAWFPTSPTEEVDAIGRVHFACAAALFLTLAVFSFFQFTKSKEGVEPTPRKRKRNAVYRSCGVVIVVCIIAMAAYPIWIKARWPIPRFIFWGETVALVAFGFSWLTKGEALLADK